MKLPPVTNEQLATAEKDLLTANEEYAKAKESNASQSVLKDLITKRDQIKKTLDVSPIPSFSCFLFFLFGLAIDLIDCLFFKKIICSITATQGAP
jgi:hypothetical protein